MEINCSLNEHLANESKRVNLLATLTEILSVRSHDTDAGMSGKN